MRVAFGEYQLDTKTRTLQREGRRIPVQSKAFDLLAYLIERRDQVVSSNELLDALWPGLLPFRGRFPLIGWYWDQVSHLSLPGFMSLGSSLIGNRSRILASASGGMYSG